MIKQITFNGISSQSLGLYCKSISRPVLPSIRSRSIEIPGISGIFDFGAETHETRPIIVQIAWATAGTDFEFRQKIRDIAAWLDTETWEDLIFNDEPDKLYKAHVIGGVNLTSMNITGQATISFQCQPYAYALYSTGTEYTWATADFPWMSELPLDCELSYSEDFTSPGNLVFNNPGTQKSNYQSPQGSKFQILITGTFTTLTLALNGKTLNYTEALASGTLIIDNLDMTVYVGGTNKLSVVTGDYATFLSCIAGANTLAISGTALNITVTVDIIPMWL